MSYLPQQQEDVFHPTQTLMEAVLFQAVMRLGSDIPDSKKKLMARELIIMAGLKGKVRPNYPLILSMGSL